MPNRLSRISLVAVLATSVVACAGDSADLVPTVPDQSVHTNEEVPVIIDGAFHAAGFDVAALSVTEIMVPAIHTAELLHGSSIRVTPADDFNGSFPVRWTVSDGHHSLIAHATVVVNPVDFPLTATGGSLEVLGPIDITLGAKGGAGAPSRIFTIIQGPSSGTLTGDPPMLHYVPAEGFTGNTQITYSVIDRTVPLPVAGTLHLHVTAGPGPFAFDGAVSGFEDKAIQVQLAASDSQHRALRYKIVRYPQHGAISPTAPNLTYTPNADFSGTDSLQFSVDNDSTTSRTATVSIDLWPVNDAPTALAQSVTVTEDLVHDIKLIGHDVDGDVLRYTVTDGPANGTLLGDPPNLTYQPKPNFHGTDSFKFTVRDPSLETSPPATVSITIDSVEDPPTAGSFSLSLAEDTPTPITLAGSDADGDPITYSYATPAHGTVTGGGPVVTYTPARDFSGTDSFTYTATSRGTISARGTVSLTVTPVNDAPIATSSEVTIDEDTPVTIALQASDVDSSQLSFSITVLPTDGTLTGGTGASRTYTPAHNATGTRSFTFRASDSDGASATATVTIHITPVNDAPIALDDFVTTEPGAPLTFSATANDSDPDGDPIVLDSLVAPAHGDAQIVDGKILYTPDAGFTGVEVFGYTIADPAGVTATAQVHVGVGGFPPGAPAEVIATIGVNEGDDNDSVTAISNDGRYVAFTSALALVPGDTNGVADVYLYDRNTRGMTRISRAADGGPGNDRSRRPQLSADGRYVVFESTATNLIAGDTNGKPDIFRFDRVTGDTVRVSIATSGHQASGVSFNPVISDDGNLIAFMSDAFDLIDDDANGAIDVFVRDVAAGTTSRVSVTASGHEADQMSAGAAISGDGRYVAFFSAAINLVDGDTNNVRDVFVRDRVAGTTTRVSVSSVGEEADQTCTSPAISRTGRFVSFVTSSTKLVSGAPLAPQAYVRDQQEHSTIRPVTSSDSVNYGTLSGDGRYLLATTSGNPFVRDRFAAITATPAGSQRWRLPALSGNSQYIVALDTSNGGRLTVAPNPLAPVP